MNLGLISLIALLAAIVIGFVRKANVGILCIGFSMILGLVYGIKAGDIIKGFSSSLCMQMTIAAKRAISEIRPRFIGAPPYRNVMQTGLSAAITRPVYSMRPCSESSFISMIVSLSSFAM